MVFIEDTRNQIGKHKNITNRLEELGHKVVRSKLIVGDYSRADLPTVAIDTKQDYVELASNICGKEHARFRAECERAKEIGYQLIILVEENCPAIAWQPPRRKNGKLLTKVNPSTLAKAMETMYLKYDVGFTFCDKNKTADKIIELVGGVK
jgi:ERCC4-type nuclease